MIRPTPNGKLILQHLKPEFNERELRWELHPHTETFLYEHGYVFAQMTTGFQWWIRDVDPRIYYFVPWDKIISIVNITNTDQYVEEYQEWERQDHPSHTPELDGKWCSLCQETQAVNHLPFNNFPGDPNGQF